MYYETYMTNIMLILGNIIKKKSKMHEQILNYGHIDVSKRRNMAKKPLLNQSINQSINQSNRKSLNQYLFNVLLYFLSIKTISVHSYL